MVNPVIYVILQLLTLYSFVVIASVLLNLLFYFNVVNRFNGLIRMVDQVLTALTDPVYRPFQRLQRRLMSGAIMVDLSPLIVLLLLNFLRYTILYYAI